MTTHHTLKNWFYSGKTLNVPIDVEGYNGTISEKNLKGIAELLYMGNTHKLHRSSDVRGIGTNQDYLHEEDHQLLEVEKYKAGKIDTKTNTVTTVGSITIGKTGSVSGGKHRFA